MAKEGCSWRSTASEMTGVAEDISSRRLKVLEFNEEGGVEVARAGERLQAKFGCFGPMGSLVNYISLFPQIKGRQWPAIMNETKHDDTNEYL